jgi:hypothetical protein
MMFGACEGLAPFKPDNMNDPKTACGVPADADRRPTEISVTRYSLKEMMAEVRLERTLSALGRELLDSTEIDKLFAGRRHRQMK